MTTQNYEVVKEFLNGSNEKIKAKHLFFQGNVLYSYGSHFPLCVKLQSGFIINSDGYSKTTATHKGYVSYCLTGLTFKELEKHKNNFENSIYFMDTEQIEELFNNPKLDLKKHSVQSLKRFLLGEKLKQEPEPVLLN